MEFAHHDGSSRYVSTLTPELGDTVSVKVRVRSDAGVQQVQVRAGSDGEPRYFRAELVDSNGVEDWYEAAIVVRNPVQHYRFLLVRDNGYLWLNGAGIHDREVSDAHDFRITIFDPASEWARESVLYQIFPDRFARSSDAPPLEDMALPDWAVPRSWDTVPQAKAPETPYEFYGGDLRGIAEHLDYLQDLGVTGVYLCPIFPSQSNHRYDAGTFDEVDPLLGGDEALAELAAAVHERGMTILGDLTTNHTGETHEWFITAKNDRTAPEANYYYWTDDELGYEAWLGVPSLPKLNYNSSELRQRFVEGESSVVAKWLRPPFNLDGWRIDVANMTGRRGSDDFTHEVARIVRKTMEEQNPNTVLIAEHFHDATHDVVGDGWHGNMNYSAFSRPIWSWLVDPDNQIDFLGIGVPIPTRRGKEVVDNIRDFQAQIPWKVVQAQWNMLDSHDTPRIRTLSGSVDRTIVAVTFLLTVPGTPVIFSGDEIGGVGTNGEHSRTTIPWGEEIPAESDLRPIYRSLIGLRRRTPALVNGSWRWIVTEDDAIAYVRETDDESLLIVLTRDDWTGSIGLTDLGIDGDLTVEFTHGQVQVEPASDKENTITVTAQGATATVLRFA